MNRPATLLAPAEAGLIETTVESVEPVAAGVVSLVLRRADGESFPRWSPGSHIDVHLGTDLTRQYSLCSSPEDPYRVRIAVLRVPDSRGGSDHVHRELHVGDSLEISAPRNNFPLVDSRKYLFLAGGIGITPIIPMIEDAEAAGREWRLYYGGRSRETMAFGQYLQRQYGTDRVHLIAEDLEGRVDLDEILGLPRAHTLVYACGPAGMLHAVEDLCMGWPPGTLHTERFVAQSLGTGGTSQPFEVELARSGGSVTVTPEETIIDAVEAAGARVLSSCKAGLCGTCETRVIQGKPEHRDSVLTQQDKDSGDVMLVCVSRAAAGCPRLVLDL